MESWVERDPVFPGVVTLDVPHIYFDGIVRWLVLRLTALRAVEVLYNPKDQ